MINKKSIGKKYIEKKVYFIHMVSATKKVYYIHWEKSILYPYG